MLVSVGIKKGNKVKRRAINASGIVFIPNFKIAWAMPFDAANVWVRCGATAEKPCKRQPEIDERSSAVRRDRSSNGSDR